MPRAPRRRLIGTAAERCPLEWEDVQRILGLLPERLRQVGHCPFCGRFFWRREGFPRKPKIAGGRRCGTQTCYEAWKFDQQLGGAEE